MLSNYIAERFWNHVEKLSEDECWIWTGRKSGYPPRQYGQPKICGKFYKAHRIAYELAYGEIPDGLFVCHSCDTPLCVNSHHLWLGTAADNAHDRDAKGRQRGFISGQTWAQLNPDLIKRGKDSWISQHPERRAKGERVHGSKLTKEQVMTIRDKYKEGQSQSELARRYGVRQSSIWCIVTRKTWRHVE